MRREILLTGATGVLGSELVAVLLRDPDTTLQVLLRASSHRELDERRREVVAYATRAGAPEAEHRVRAVRGDVSLPSLGMEGTDYALAAGATTHVIHAAGDVRFDRSIEEARRTAVYGIEHIIAFLRDAVGPTKLEYISTVGVAGRRTGVILEEPQPPDPRGFRNAYEQAKAEAEQILLEEMGRGLDATIHRPTMIVGDSVTGRVRSHHGFYFLVDYFLGRKSDTVVPDCGALPMDTVPVDYVANAIDFSTGAPELSGTILHLGSGPGAWSIADIVAHARALLQERGRDLPSVTTLSLERFGQHLAAKCAAGSRFHKLLAQFEPYFGASIEFDNRRAAALLVPAGIQVPVMENYLTAVLSAYWAVGRASARS